MATTLRPEELVDNAVVDVDGRKIGKVGTVYLSDESRQPEWVTVRTGLFGQKESFVPLQGAHMESDGVHVSVSKDQVSDAPRTDTDTDLTGEESAELYSHYNLPAPRAAMPEETGTSGTAETAGTTGEGGRPGDTGMPRSRAEGESMTRSEERLRASTENVETGRVRLHKYVVTEEQQVTVPVSHEEVRLEREPVTGAERGTTHDIGEEEQEVTLHREEPHVTKESVPVEKVRLGKEKVTEDETISGEVRREKFDIEEERGRGGSER
ncbi:DUF2382 domain-containing protein [Saccharomonospora cyanea]|uniref:Uncharacterized protein n=1 Tax=Saccharomonospora cyanea NA-134 TaxID=882082 RepID=H5XKV2_9PSEU|nr:PRC and DUF2382 domain-containing protein [Saccharomonospora cyanea]EHR61947.1 hypothetical protein SaccyDRAFT_3108 [Saccharomonospora cyanea NA-134]